MKNGYSMKSVQSVEEFEALSSSWAPVAMLNTPILPFVCHDWFRVWLRHFAFDNQLRIFALAEDEVFFAFAPFLMKKERYRGCRVRKLELMGNTYSPVRLFIVDHSSPEQVGKAVDAFLSGLKEQKELSWDVLDLDSLPEESSFFEILVRYMEDRQIPFYPYPCFGDWYQDGIDCSGEEYLSLLPEKIRKDFQYCKRRLEREGRLEFRVVYAGEGVEEAIDAYYGVYGRSWQKQEKIGPTFHRDLARIAAERGWLRLAFLYQDDLPIAAQFWMVSGATAYILKTVYDQEYRKYSPGKVLTSEMFRYVIDVDGVTSIDYVQGDEDYKKDWTPKRRERKGILVYNDTPRGRFLAFLDRRLVPFVNGNRFLRRLKDGVSVLVRRG
jgi:hypothetical protein